MRKVLLLLVFALPLMAGAQVNTKESCTSIMVGKRASTDGSVITSHTCDGRYRTWMYMEPAVEHSTDEMHIVRKGTMHTRYRTDTVGVKVSGGIPQVKHTFAYLNTAYPCLNERQLAIGETTFGGPDTLANPNGMFTIEELERVALMRCSTARDAIRLIGSLIKQYGYGDAGECITIADRKEVWQMEILGEGRNVIGGIWAAQRVPDDHVAVSANIPRIGKLMRDDPDNFMCSDNIEAVAKKYKLWNGKGTFVFWKAFTPAYANGKNFREREYFIFSRLAPSLNLRMDMAELPFSVKPDRGVSVADVMALLRSTYEGTELDMCRNVKSVVNRKDAKGKVYADTIISPIANPWMTNTMINTLNYIAPRTVEFRRTVSVAWCSYSFVAQLRDWLPDEVGGVAWVALDNPGQSPRVPIFCGTTRLPKAYALCGQKAYEPNSALWKYRKANKLATLAWQRTQKDMMSEVARLEKADFDGMDALENEVKIQKSHGNTNQVSELLNEYTRHSFDNSTEAWSVLESKYWHMFGMGF